jgi:hypothetical protein
MCWLPTASRLSPPRPATPDDHESRPARRTCAARAAGRGSWQPDKPSAALVAARPRNERREVRIAASFATGRVTASKHAPTTSRWAVETAVHTPRGVLTAPGFSRCRLSRRLTNPTPPPATARSLSEPRTRARAPSRRTGSISVRRLRRRRPDLAKLPTYRPDKWLGKILLFFECGKTAHVAIASGPTRACPEPTWASRAAES